MTPDDIENMDSDRINVAQQLLEENRLAESLEQWRILLLRSPENLLFSERVDSIEAQIGQRKKILMRSLRENKTKAETKHTLLQILALDPNDRLVESQLSDLSFQRELANANQKAVSLAKGRGSNVKKVKVDTRLNKILKAIDQSKANKTYTLMLKLIEELKVLAPEHEQIEPFSFIAHQALAENYKRDELFSSAIDNMELAKSFASENDRKKLGKEIKTLRDSLAKKYLLAAQKVFTQDIDQAIEYLNQALLFDENNPRIRQQLSKAQTIKKNLQSIKSKN